jgi:beta-lactamase superfamily II metal-dependent hydrolase
MRVFLLLLAACVTVAQGFSPAGVMVQSAAAQTTAKTLQIYYVDTEGGQSTLFVAPSGESLLVDVGNPGGRDTDRIMLAIEDAGVKQIDHLVLTHYHGDHVGGLAELAKRMPIKKFYDHGPAAEGDRAGGQGFMEQYAEIYGKAPRTVVKPGDKLTIPGLEITVVSSAGQVLKTNLPGAGRPNPACAGFAEKDLSKVFDPDNAYSVGFVLGFGRFRTIDLGDLTWNHEGQLMCPNNRIGTVDLYLTTHHGINQSNAPAMVHALQPRVAIMNNGTRKGGSLETFQALAASPGLEDLWQLHWSHNVMVEHNAPGVFIANIEDNATLAGILTAPPPAPRGTGAAPGAPGSGGGRGGGGRGNAPPPHTPAYWIKVTAQQDGTFTVTNARNGFSKTYGANRK